MIKVQRPIKLQLFADLDSIITQNPQAFEGSNVKDQFSAIATKLGELGYDVLVNNKKEAEFVPSTRLREVVSQRDTFKTKVEEQTTMLETLKKGAGDNEALKTEYQKLIDQNTSLLREIEDTKINAQFMVGASGEGAISPADLIPFMKRDAIKVDAKGNLLGVEAEIARLKAEKPYMFAQPGSKSKGGMENGGGGDNKPSGMNAMIRRAAGRQF